MDEEMIATSVTFPATLLERVKKVADDDERSVSYVLRKAAETYLAQYEQSTQREQAAPTREKKGSK